MGDFKFGEGIYVSRITHVTGQTHLYSRLPLSRKSMWELRLIAAFLLVLIQKSVGQSTNILSKKYRQIGVTVVSWNSMEVRATGFLGMGSAR